MLGSFHPVDGAAAAAAGAAAAAVGYGDICPQFAPQFVIAVSLMLLGGCEYVCACVRTASVCEGLR